MTLITNFDALNALRSEAARTGHGSKGWIEFASAIFDSFPALYETAKRMNAEMAELRSNREHFLDETEDWIDSSQQLPDSDITVVINTPGSSEPVWLGFYDGDVWRNIEGFPIDVTAWMDMPEPYQMQPLREIE